MHRQHRSRPSLEMLEDRSCPAVSLKTTFANGLLMITGRPTGNGTSPAASLSITRTVGSNYAVFDNSVLLGQFAITRGVVIALQDYNSNITVDLNGGVFRGNIFMNLGRGDRNLATANPISILGNGTAADRVLGSVIVVNGSGQEAIVIGAATPVDLTPDATAITVAGNVIVNGAPQRDAGFFSSFGPGNFLSISPGSTVLGSVNAVQVANVVVGAFSATGGAVNGSLYVNNRNAPIIATVDIIGRVGGNVSVVGSNNDDIFSIMDNLSGTPGFVGGNVTLQLGSGGSLGNLINLDPGTIVGKNFTATGDNTGVFAGFGLGFNGTIGGNLSLNLGNGINTVGVGATGVIGGATSMVMGNGGNTIEIAGTLAKNATFILGNGVNSLTVSGAFLGTQLTYLGGTVGDAVTLATGAVNAYRAQVIFKSGDRSFTMDPATVIGNLFLDFGIGSGLKTLVFSPTQVTGSQVIRNYF